eukprot:477387-Hanusia_phi.AAC.2
MTCYVVLLDSPTDQQHKAISKALKDAFTPGRVRFVFPMDIAEESVNLWNSIFLACDEAEAPAMTIAFEAKLKEMGASSVIECGDRLAGIVAAAFQRNSWLIQTFADTVVFDLLRIAADRELTEDDIEHGRSFVVFMPNSQDGDGRLRNALVERFGEASVQSVLPRADHTGKIYVVDIKEGGVNMSVRFQKRLRNTFGQTKVLSFNHNDTHALRNAVSFCLPTRDYKDFAISVAYVLLRYFQME